MNPALNSLKRIKKYLRGDEEIPIMYVHALMAIIGSLSVLFILEFKELPMSTIEHSLFVLVEKTCVILVIAYVVSRISYFTEILDGKFTIKNQVIMILIFGAISIFGTYSGVEIFGAMANVRDLGPMVAGLIGGPVMGLGAGLIGGLYRLSLGGFTAVPCAISTILAGLLAGIVFLINKKKFIGVFWAVIFAVLIESMHMLINLIVAKPYTQALAVVNELSVPMIFANALGMFIFALIISNMLRERETIRQRDLYFDELERKKHESEVANKIQKSFLPEKLPNIPGFDLETITLTANEISGAFYDFIPISKEKIGIVVADVIGESLPASLLMALSRTIIRSEAKQKNPSSMLTYLNNLITIDIGPEISITIFYSELNLENHILKYVNSSHNPPLILRAKTNQFEKLIKDNKLLGKFEHINLQEHELTIYKGDILVFYTYGVIKALESSENSGEENLKKIIIKNSDLNLKEMTEKIKNKVILSKNNADDLLLAFLRANK